MKRKVTLTAFILVLILLLGGCGSKTPITAESFKASLEALDFYVMDVTQLYSSKDTCQMVYKATAPDDKYSMNFYQYSSATAAMNEFLYLSTGFEDTDESSGTNYNRMVYQNAGTYTAVIRIDNTVLHASIPTLYAERAIEVIGELGY